MRQFAAAIGGVATNARALPRSEGVRELADGLVTSTESEAEAIRRLRDSWRPFDVDVYRTFEARRTVAAKLLRQLAVSLDELLARFDLTLTK